MNKFAVFIGLIIVLLTTMAFADGTFIGIVKHNGCDWAPGEKVKIYPSGSPGDSVLFTVSCCDFEQNGFFNTSPTTFPPGNYVFIVRFGQTSECDHSGVLQISHGSSNQTVIIEVYGAQGQGD